MIPKVAELIRRAQDIMSRSHDPIHDLDHSRRVAGYASTLAKEMHLSTDQHDALVIAAWWHDASRTLTKKPSMVWMACIDDMLSSLMLTYEILRLGMLRGPAGMAARLILCKSLGTGALLTKIFIRRRNRILVDVIKDADMLDILTTERLVKIIPLVESSRLYHLSYRTMLRWLMSRTSYLKMKTAAARKYAIRLLRALIDWVQQEAIFAWHVAEFGLGWSRRLIRRGERLLRKMERMQARAIGA
jgi:hypothetical protein